MTSGMASILVSFPQLMFRKGRRPEFHINSLEARNAAWKKERLFLGNVHNEFNNPFNGIGAECGAWKVLVVAMHSKGQAVSFVMFHETVKSGLVNAMHEQKSF